MGSLMETDMRNDLFMQFQRLDFSFYDKNNTGDMASRILTDLFDISEFAHHGPENILIAVLKIFGTFILLFLINVPLTLIMLAATIIMGIYSAWTNYRRRVIFSANRKRMGGMNSQISDSIGGIKTVKSFGNEDNEIKKFKKINNEYLETKKQSYKFIANFVSANSLFSGVLYTVTIVGGGYCVAIGSLNVNELAIFALYVGIILSPIEVLINFTETFQKSYAGFKRFIEILEHKPDIVDSKDAIELVQGQSLDIKYDNVYFAYSNSEKEITLKGVSFEVEEGSKLALVGPSGEGKSTICALLPRFYNADKGEISIGGININNFRVSSLRDAIGIVQQDVYLFNGTIFENIAYSRANASFDEIVEAAKAANIHDFINQLPDGYNTLVGERGARLSGGQKQRIAIARLFLKKPRIIILDEATSALDNESERYVQDSLDKLCKGKTTIVIAHRLSTIKSVDKIAVVSDGKIAEYGTHDTLIKNNGIYKNFHDLQFQ